MIASITSTRLIIANENQLKHRQYVAIAKGTEWLQRLAAERKTCALISYRQMSIKARFHNTGSLKDLFLRNTAHTLYSYIEIYGSLNNNYFNMHHSCVKNTKKLNVWNKDFIVYHAIKN